jgi:hypothetical protein
MFELDPKLKDAKVIISWIPDPDFLPTGVTFVNPTCSISIYKNSKTPDPNPSAMLSGSAELSEDEKSIRQLIVGGVPGAKYVIEFFADFSDTIQRDGVRATIEVE